MHCPASVRMAAEYGRDQQETKAAAEGTRAHLVAEYAARREFFGDTRIVVPDDDEMRDAASGWVRVLEDAKEKHHPSASLLLEVKVDTTIPSCSGTADAVIVGPGRVDVLDLKYGRGEVDPEENKQLMLYALGVYRQYSMVFDIDVIGLTIYQPRLSKAAKLWETTPQRLQEFAGEAEEMADEALHAAHPRIRPSEEACRFCPAAGVCRARAEWETSLAFGDPNVLTSYEVASILRQIPSLLRWCEAVRGSAKFTIQSGSVIPGWSVKTKKGSTRIVDPRGLKSRLESLGYTDALKPANLPQVRKVLGDKFDDIAGEFVERGDDQLMLVDDQQELEKMFGIVESEKDE